MTLSLFAVNALMIKPQSTLLILSQRLATILRLTDRQLLLMKSGIGYKLTSSCGFTYIGQTRRYLLSKIKEHATSEKSEV